MGVECVRRVPENFPAFVEEVSAGLSRLYGPAAAEDYRRKAPPAIASAISHPAVRVWAAQAPDSGAAGALLVSAVRDGVGQISFLHVLRPFIGHGLEGRLVTAAVAHLRTEHLSGIAAEPVALCPLDIAPAFDAMGFQLIERQLMMAPLHTKTFAAPLLPESVTADPRDFGRVAELIVSAYDGHPGRELHAEVRSRAGAEGFVRTAADGAYGQMKPAYMRMIRRGGEPVAAVVGCEAAPGVGFVLQIVVRPDAQGQGLGTRLMLELGKVFQESGLDRVALGVTVSNPALRLYERLGFRKIMPVNAFVWWR